MNSRKAESCISRAVITYHYHSGHTVFFQEATMYLCDDDETSAIVQNLGGEYFEFAQQSD